LRSVEGRRTRPRGSLSSASAFELAKVKEVLLAACGDLHGAEVLESGDEKLVPSEGTLIASRASTG
jgi:hypothetical protein